MQKFRLLDFQVVNLNFESHSFEKKTTRTLQATKFGVKCLSSDGDEDYNFGIEYKISLGNKSKDFNLEIIAIAHFECDGPIGANFLTSDFVKINAPAIGFPYLRAFISNFTLSTGFNPIFLPTYNFIALAEKEKKAKQVSVISNSKKK